MASLGPMVVVAERSAAGLVEALGNAGAFPVIETNLAGAAAAIAEVQPAALVLADPMRSADGGAVSALIRKIERRRGPFMPVAARISEGGAAAIPFSVPILIEEPISRLVARLRS